ncbi:hypothetical protein N9L68_07905, partial [bacterium]|nr:hypothetical protein [bacterium]
MAEAATLEQLVVEYNADCQWVKNDKVAAAVRPQAEKTEEEVKVNQSASAVCRAAQSGLREGRRVLDSAGIRPPSVDTLRHAQSHFRTEAA